MDWLLWAAAFIAGLVLVERGADLFTDRVAEIAEKTGASQTTIGLLTAGMEWEELVVAVVAAASGHPQLALGDLVGSAIANITGSFSLGPLAKPLRTTPDDRRYVALLLVVTALVAGFLVMKGGVGRSEGAGLLLLFGLYVAFLVLAVRRGIIASGLRREDEGQSRFRGLGWDVAITFAGLAAIIVGAQLLVQASVFVARQLNVSEFLIGAVLLAVGTTLPDKVISVASALKGQPGVVLANVVGSNIFNLTFALGLAATIAPVAAPTDVLLFDLPFLGASTLLLWLFYRGTTVTRLQGILLLGLYISYLAINVIWRGGLAG